LVDTYFFLEQRRFGDRIALRTHATQAALSAEVPPLTVQLLVENALKHNRATDDEPLVITIEASADTLTVTNPFRPRDTSAKSTGFGIDSIRQRFAAITSRSVAIGPENGNFVARLPLIPPSHEDPDR
jgi:LytS/YehU family sensor histidine kinase